MPRKVASKDEVQSDIRRNDHSLPPERNTTDRQARNDPKGQTRVQSLVPALRQPMTRGYATETPHGPALTRPKHRVKLMTNTAESNPRPHGQEAYARHKVTGALLSAQRVGGMKFALRDLLAPPKGPVGEVSFCTTNVTASAPDWAEQDD